jgi:predicted Holliday junction resolvase-like endonuclease
MKTGDLIKRLKESGLYAICPDNQEEFNLANALLFDGTKPFPKEALGVQQMLQQELTDREEEFKKRQKLIITKAQITTRAVNIGKNLEKILPTMEDFKWTVPDCKFLGDPIDLIVFDGLSTHNVNSISFVEVKSGHATLKKNQKSIRDAIEDKKVSYKVV